MGRSPRGTSITQWRLACVARRATNMRVDSNSFSIQSPCIFQRFIMILSEHFLRCDTDGIDFKTPWYRWTVGRLQQVFMMHHEQVEKYSTTLETLLFTQDLDPNILDVFQQFVALRL